MRVGEACTRDVVIVDAEESVLQAAGLMREFHVGDVVVTEKRNGKRFPIGILTDRDIVVELVAKEIDVKSVAVKDVMSFKLLSVNEQEDVHEAVGQMKEKGVRRLPVVDRAGALAGIMTVDDVIELIAEQVAGLVSLNSKARALERKQRH